MTQSVPEGRKALEHVRQLMQMFAGRASCSPEERQAGEYIVEQLSRMGVGQVRLESFLGVPSTYAPFIVAFSTALAGALMGALIDFCWVLLLSAGLVSLAVWGFWTELDLHPSWLRRMIPTAPSQNVLGVILPAEELHHRVVICAHVDTHRAPLMFSSPGWQRAFNLLLMLTMLGMVLCAAAYLLGFVFALPGVRWVGLAVTPLVAFSLVMSIQAHRAPLSPGANDNTSAVGVALQLAERLSGEPLAHTEIWLVFTGCEEVGAYGMTAFLDQHAEELGADAFYLVLEQVGTGRLQLVTAEGLVIKRPVREEALSFGRKVGAILPELQLTEKVGEAYSDALPAIQRGFLALTITGNPPSVGEPSHWHQLSDTVQYIDPESLQQAFDFSLEIIRQVDCSESAA
jgi:hypothetical protein